MKIRRAVTGLKSAVSKPVLPAVSREACFEQAFREPPGPAIFRAGTRLRWPPENGGIPLAKSAQAVARVAKREVRVAARGTARNQAARRWRSIAAAVATCCRWVLASPR